MSTDMVRKQIYILRRQQSLLKRLARQRGTSEAEVIRQAIDREASIELFPSTGDSQTAFDELVQAALARRQLPMDGEPYQFNRQEIYEEREKRWIKKD